MTITLTAATVTGGNGATLAELDATTVALAATLGGPADCPEVAADFLRDVYSEVIRTAGAVTLVALTTAVEVAA